MCDTIYLKKWDTLSSCWSQNSLVHFHKIPMSANSVKCLLAPYQKLLAPGKFFFCLLHKHLSEENEFPFLSTFTGNHDVPAVSIKENFNSYPRSNQLLLTDISARKFWPYVCCNMTPGANRSSSSTFQTSSTLGDISQGKKKFHENNCSERKIQRN